MSNSTAAPPLIDLISDDEEEEDKSSGGQSPQKYVNKTSILSDTDSTDYEVEMKVPSEMPSTSRGAGSSNKVQVHDKVNQLFSHIKTNLLGILENNFENREEEVSDNLTKFNNELQKHPERTFQVLFDLIKFADPGGVAKSDVNMKNQKAKKKIYNSDDILKPMEQDLRRMESEMEKMDSRNEDWTREQKFEFSNLSERYSKLYEQYVKLLGKEIVPLFSVTKKFNLKNISMYPDINEGVNKYMNRLMEKFSSGKKQIRSFRDPTFEEILEVAKESAEMLHLDSDQIHSSANELYRYIIKKIKVRRERDLWRNIMNTTKRSDREDPAASHTNLDETLHRNARIAATRYEEVLNYFVHQENQKPEVASQSIDVDAMDTDQPDNVEGEDTFAEEDKNDNDPETNMLDEEFIDVETIDDEELEYFPVIKGSPYSIDPNKINKSITNEGDTSGMKEDEDVILLSASQEFDNYQANMCAETCYHGGLAKRQKLHIVS